MVNTISEALSFGNEQLKNADIESFILDSLILLCHALNCDKQYLIIHKNDLIKEADFKTYKDYIEKRKKNMPVKYITGVCEFMSLDFIIDQNVLIPRPDTEILVEKVISDFSTREGLKVLDLCCGSGCIGVSLASYLKGAFVTMADISKPALEISKKNILKHNLKDNIKLLNVDILNEKIEGKFDIITSNPPYINEEDYERLDDNVKLYEPEIALVSRDDEYKFYKRIICEYYKNLNIDGRMYLEMGYNQSEYLYNYAISLNKYKKVEIIKDLNGIDRVLCLIK